MLQGECLLAALVDEGVSVTVSRRCNEYCYWFTSMGAEREPGNIFGTQMPCDAEEA